jgi:hypothetical protein
MGAEDLRTWAAGRTEQATLAKQAFTAVVDQSRPFTDQFAAKNLSNIFKDVSGVLGPIHGGGKAATESASRIGMASEVLVSEARNTARAAKGKFAASMAKHGTAIALGLGSLAALGVAMTSASTPVASFSRSSGNKYRPEDRIGISDHIPGESMEGLMAPSNPPRREVPNQPGVRTTVVAPMRQTSDLSVRMRAEDQSRAADTARQLAQIPGSGNTNVTINYRDRTKLRSLRTREKVRDILQ